MAGDNKQLIIGSKFDSKGIALAEKALKNLRKESEQFNKAFKMMTDPSNTRKQAMFAKEIVNSTTGMNKFKLATRIDLQDYEGSVSSSFK